MGSDWEWVCGLHHCDTLQICSLSNNGTRFDDIMIYFMPSSCIVEQIILLTVVKSYQVIKIFHAFKEHLCKIQQ